MRYRAAIVMNPPSPPGYVSNKDSAGGYGSLYPKGAPPPPPMDLAYLAAVLDRAGCPVTVIESVGLDLSEQDVRERLSRHADLAATLLLVRTSLPTIDLDLEFCRSLRMLGAIGGIAIFGSPLPALLHRVEQETDLDFVILSEADGPAVELMAGADPASIDGLLYRKEGRWVRTQQRAFPLDLDSLPFPLWDKFPIERYAAPKSSASGTVRYWAMLTSRGCPFGCSYCTYPTGQGLKWRYRSPGNVVDEMEHLARTFGVEHILFRDPMFSAQQKRVLAICDEIVRRGLKVQWKCETRVDCLDAETIEAMARAGCVGVNFGVESIDPDVQKGVHRQPITNAEFISVVESCRRQGISTFALFVIGLPGDTLETILESIEFAMRMRASWLQFSIATPLVGTPLHDWAVAGGYIAAGSYRMTNLHGPSIGNENLSGADITRLHGFAKILQNYLVNRGGVLKNDRRTGFVYRLAKGAADASSALVALGLVRIAGAYFRLTVKAAPPRPKVRLSGSGPVAFSPRQETEPRESPTI